MEKKKTKSSFWSKLSRTFKKSAVIYGISKFSAFIYNTVSKSIFAKIFTSYDAVSAWAADSAIGHSFGERNYDENDKSRKVRRKISSAGENSFFISFIKNFFKGMLVLPMPAFGVFLFSVGVYDTVIFLLKKYTFDVEKTDVTDIIIGIALIAVSFAFFLSRKSLAQCISESKIMRFVLFDIFNFRPGEIENAAARQASAGVSVSFVLGMALGLLSIVVSPFKIVVTIAAVIAVAMTISSPESAVIFVCLALPFLPTMMLVAIIALTALSFFFKIISGKRVIRLTLIDVPILFFLVLTVFGGIISKASSSVEKMLVMVCFMLAYFIIKNLIRSEKLLGKCVNAMAISGFAVSAIGIFENYFGSPSTVWQDISAFGDIKGRVVSTFENPNVLGEFLIIVIPITVAAAIASKNKFKSVFFAFAAAADTFCLLLTWSRGAWLGFAVSAVLFLLLISRHFLSAGILFFPAAFLGMTFASGSVISRITSIFTASDTSSTYRINIWRGTLKMLREVFAGGIGIGEQAFSAVYPTFALRGIEAAPHSHSLYLQITTELGIVGIITFAVFVFVLVQMNVSQIANSTLKRNRVMVIGVFCGLVAFLLMGFTDYVWYNYRIFLYFWITVAISASAVSVSKTMTGEAGDMFY